MDNTKWAIKTHQRNPQLNKSSPLIEKEDLIDTKKLAGPGYTDKKYIL